jgi:hypothetical protein
MSATFSGQDRSRHMGELRRGDDRWDVYLECQPDASVAAVRGRLHFVGRESHHETGWIFLEPAEGAIRERFGEFSAVELWHFLESVLPGPTR